MTVYPVNAIGLYFKGSHGLCTAEYDNCSCFDGMFRSHDLLCKKHAIEIELPNTLELCCAGALRLKLDGCIAVFMQSRTHLSGRTDMLWGILATCHSCSACLIVMMTTHEESQTTVTAARQDPGKTALCKSWNMAFLLHVLAL